MFVNTWQNFNFFKQPCLWAELHPEEVLKPAFGVCESFKTFLTKFNMGKNIQLETKINARKLLYTMYQLT